MTGPETLVIASSNSGNTEETLAAAEIARERGARLLAITTGGQLADHAARHGYPLWQFDYKSQPRAALGWSLGLLLGLADRLKLAPDLGADLAARSRCCARRRKATARAAVWRPTRPSAPPGS